MQVKKSFNHDLKIVFLFWDDIVADIASNIKMFPFFHVLMPEKYLVLNRS